MTFYKKIEGLAFIHRDAEGDYRFALDLAVDGAFTFDPGRCTVVFKLDDRELLRETYGWQDFKPYRYSPPGAPDGRRPPADLRDRAPDPARETAHARSISGSFRSRRKGRWTRSTGPARPTTTGSSPRTSLRRLIPSGASMPARSWAGSRRGPSAAPSMTARSTGWWRSPKGSTASQASVSSKGWRGPWWPCSPRRGLCSASRRASRKRARRHQASVTSMNTALASRLSYFLWSTMPDDELTRLAERGELRKDLARQVKRMRADARAESLTQNFVGQWLQVHDVEGFTINVRAVLRQDGGVRQRITLDTELRRAMRRETEMLFAHIAREDRSLLELIDSDYTFLNAKLAQLYGIKGVSGKEMRKVTLPKDSPRGGVLTHASVLLVTSNPTRTSPVKRGQFILDNLLGTPAPPPPPDIPALEESKNEFKGRTPTVRELMALHRAKPLCSSCHSRMDPLGLALENFNALGLWREKESGQPIDASGRLITGESFHDVRDLKRILKERHYLDFYRCLTEKLLTYALGRGLDYHDVETVDRIVERLDREGGRFSALLMGVIESAPFQKRREVATAAATAGLDPDFKTQC